MMKRLQQIIALLSFNARLGGDACVVALIVLVTSEVVARKVFGFSTLMADEYSAYFLVGVVGLGLADTLLSNGHVSVQILESRLSGFSRDVLALLSNLVGFSFTVLLTWHAVMLAVSSYEGDIRSIMHMRTPLYIPQIVLIAGSSILGLAFFGKVLEAVGRLASSERGAAQLAVNQHRRPREGGHPDRDVDTDGPIETAYGERAAHQGPPDIKREV